MQTLLVIDNVRSVMNVGSMFRTANALGIGRVILSGIAPGPLDRFGVPRKDFAKVSLGAEQSVTWEHVPETLALVETLRAEGWHVIALEQDPRAEDYKEIKLEGFEKVALLVGPEVEGVSRAVLDRVSCIAEIPMKGSKESFNVSVAFGIAGYRFFDRG